MHNLFLIYLLLAPIYILPNGMPQIADVVIGFGSSYFLFGLRTVNRLGLMLLFLFLLSVVINLSVTVLIESNDSKQPLLASLFLLPNLISVLAFQDELPMRYIRKIARVFFVVLIVELITILFGSDFVRATGTFNNPNQLAFYVVTVTSLILIGDSRSEMKEDSRFILLILILSSTIVVFTASRIAMIAIPIWMISRLKFKDIKNYIFLILGIITAWLTLKADSFIALTRLAAIGNEGVSFLEERGLDRLYLYPKCLIFGCGEGYFSRFELSYHNLEVHSLFGSIFFSYGIIGLAVVVRYFTTLSWKMKWREFIAFLPVILFNLVHNGSRKSYFWLSLLIISFYVTGKLDRSNDSKRNHHSL